jgi:hypothetical protein
MFQVSVTVANPQARARPIAAVIGTALASRIGPLINV